MASEASGRIRSTEVVAADTAAMHGALLKKQSRLERHAGENDDAAVVSTAVATILVAAAGLVAQNGNLYP